jgi:hypothetical protein
MTRTYKTYHPIGEQHVLDTMLLQQQAMIAK